MSDLVNEEHGGTAGTPRPAHVITTGNLVDKLLFCFFAHNKDISSKIENQTVRLQAKKTLIEVLGIVFKAVSHGNFPKNNYRWINDEVIANNFTGRKFNQYNKYIYAGDIDFYNTKAGQLRAVFAVLAAVSRSIFIDNNNINDEWINRVRAILKVNHNNNAIIDSFKEQKEVLGQIESVLRSLEATPKQSITYNTEGNLIIKTKETRNFIPPSALNKTMSWIFGRYIIYRKLFYTEEYGNNEFVREYLILEKSPLGPIFRWESRGTNVQSERTIFKGAVVCTEGAIWLICNTDKPFQRMRILAAETAEWREHCDNNDNRKFCSGIVMSHKQVAQRYEPICRRVIFFRELSSHWETVNDELMRIKELTRAEVIKLISRDQFRAIDEPI